MTLSPSLTNILSIIPVIWGLISTSSWGITLPVATILFYIVNIFKLSVSYIIRDLLFDLIKKDPANKIPTINNPKPILFNFII